MAQVQTKTVMFEVAQDIKLDPGLVLPTGFYTGTKTQTRLYPIASGKEWTDPQYYIEFTAEELASMGAQGRPPNPISQKIEVTKFVHSGQLVVA